MLKVKYNQENIFFFFPFSHAYNELVIFFLFTYKNRLFAQWLPNDPPPPVRSLKTSFLRLPYVEF